jgi:hypothetical protein
MATMLPTYSGILRANRIEWTGDAPASLDANEPVRVHVTLLEPPTPSAHADQGRRMAEALARLAALPPSGLPENPVDWQRESRADRPLPGRGE